MINGSTPWRFPVIEKLPRVNGAWMINVNKAGHYRFTLRQFPAVADKPVIAVRAKIQIAGQEEESDVKPGSKGVVFEMNLPAGKTELVTYLYGFVRRGWATGGAIPCQLVLHGWLVQPRTQWKLYRSPQVFR